MCARYTLTPEQAKLVFGGLVHIFAFAPRYNIGPTQRVPVILNTAGGIQAVDRDDIQVRLAALERDMEEQKNKR